MAKTAIAATILVCLLLTHTFAQTSNATLGGTVADSSAALIPGVTITATNIGTGVVTTVLSNESGSYQFPNLQTGTYKVSAWHERIGENTQSVRIDPGRPSEIQFALPIGSR